MTSYRRPRPRQPTNGKPPVAAPSSAYGEREDALFGTTGPTLGGFLPKRKPPYGVGDAGGGIRAALRQAEGELGNNFRQLSLGGRGGEDWGARFNAASARAGTAPNKLKLRGPSKPGPGTAPYGAVRTVRNAAPGARKKRRSRSKPRRKAAAADRDAFRVSTKPKRKSRSNLSVTDTSGGLDTAKMVANFENGTELRKLQKALRRSQGSIAASTHYILRDMQLQQE